MFRVNYRPPELLPPHQQDFPPRRPSEVIQRGERSGFDGSGQLALMVALYLFAMCAGLALLTRFTTTFPNTTAAEIMAGR